MKANQAGLLVSVLRDMYLTAEDVSISFAELESYLKATETPFQILSWCILFLLGRLQDFTILSVNDMAEGDRMRLRLMWELISKHTYCNYYRCVMATESTRESNRFMRSWLPYKKPDCMTCTSHKDDEE